ncbi:hypothetical protein Hdeb2414_s0027g00687221 [Helianthus debilis subsp. tardiflorus]
MVFTVQMPLVQVIVPQVMNLKPQLRDSSNILIKRRSFASLPLL